MTTLHSLSCSWCHRVNPCDRHYCPDCGHEAQVPRLKCACPRCIFVPVPASGPARCEQCAEPIGETAGSITVTGRRSQTWCAGCVERMAPGELLRRVRGEREATR